MKYFLLSLFLLTCLTAHSQRFVRSFATIDALLATNPNDVNTNVVTFGRTGLNDGGGGQFYYDKSLTTTPTNSGMIFKPNSYGGRWVRVWNGVDLQADWFGSIANDTNSDSVPIQAAIDYAHALKRGNVHLSGGFYVINATIDLKYRVNLLGAEGMRVAEIASRDTNVTWYAQGGVTHVFLNTAANCDMIKMGSTDGWVRQPGETIEDGSVQDAIYQDSSVENIIFNGNGFNQTGFGYRGFVSENKWSVTIKNCGFIACLGHQLWLWDQNQLTIRDIWFKGNANDRSSRGMFLYSTADSIISGIYGGGAKGPQLWVHGFSSFKNQLLGAILYNAFVAETEWTPTSIDAAGVWTFASDVPMSNGEPVEFRTTGGLPGPYLEGTLYFAHRIDSTHFGFHTKRSTAMAGTYLTATGGAGTHSVTIGPASGVYVSGLANCNMFSGFRVDQCSGPGITLWYATENVFNGLHAGENDGAANLETISTNEMVGIRFDKLALRNNCDGVTISGQHIGIQTRTTAAANKWNAVYASSVTNQVQHGGSQLQLLPVERQSGASADGFIQMGDAGYATWGDTTTGTALHLKGNNSGLRLLKLERPSISQISAFYVLTDGLGFYNETDSEQLGQWSADTSNITLRLGVTRATARVANLIGEGGIGTDVAGGGLLIGSGASTGSSTSGGNIVFYTSDAAASSATAQTLTEKIRISKEGQFRFFNRATNPSVGLADGDSWYRTDLDQFLGVANGVTRQLFSGLVGLVVWDIASIGTLANDSATTTVTGATVGDVVAVGPSMPSAGVIVSADVTSADTVTLRAHNTTSGTIDPASATFRVKVIKQ